MGAQYELYNAIIVQAQRSDSVIHHAYCLVSQQKNTT